MDNNTFVPLKTKIHELVSEFKILETDQIFRYFKGIPEESIKYAIKTLKMEGYIYQSQSNKLTSINRALADIRPKEESVKAFYVMASFGHRNISFFDIVKFPKELLFVADNKLYEVAVLTKSNETVFKALIQQDQYKSTKEAINIVVVDNQKLGREMINDFGYDAYCILDSNREPVFYQQ